MTKARGLFVTATGTDVGKTYVSALIVKKMREYRYNCGYYKAAISGAKTIKESDAGIVNQVASIRQEEGSLLSYLYETPVSPHLAAKIHGNPIELEKIHKDYEQVCQHYPYVLMEGSGGIICPLRYDRKSKFLLTDLIRDLDLPVLLVADAGLGTINHTVLTAHYCQSQKLNVAGIILNRYEDTLLHQDNRYMIEELSGVPVFATVEPNATSLNCSIEYLELLFERSAT